MDATYVCKCQDGVRREFVASTQSAIEDIKVAATLAFQVDVEDLVEEIRKAQEEDLEEIADDTENAEEKNAEEHLDLGPLAITRIARTEELKAEKAAKAAPVTLYPPDPMVDWLDDVLRSQRTDVPAIYKVKAEDGEHLIRGHTVESVAEILRRATEMHRVKIIGLTDEIPLGEVKSA